MQLSIGQGQVGVKIDKMLISGGKIEILSGHGIGFDGKSEPIRIVQNYQSTPLLTKSGAEAFLICAEIMNNTRIVLSKGLSIL